MKKIITSIFVIIIILLIFVFHSFDSSSKAIKFCTGEREVTQEAVTRIVSQNGLEDWKITLTPRLGARIEYNGKSKIEDLVVKTSTGITLQTPTIEPNSPIEIQEGDMRTHK